MAYKHRQTYIVSHTYQHLPSQTHRCIRSHGLICQIHTAASQMPLKQLETHRCNHRKYNICTDAVPGKSPLVTSQRCDCAARTHGQFAVQQTCSFPGMDGWRHDCPGAPLRIKKNKKIGGYSLPLQMGSLPVCSPTSSPRKINGPVNTLNCLQLL